jgi:hypothetical protein
MNLKLFPTNPSNAHVAVDIKLCAAEVVLAAVYRL